MDIARIEAIPSVKPRVFLEDMGCQMNRLDSEIVLGKLHQAGFQRVETTDDADVVLYYTCSVREHAEDKVFGRLGSLKRLKALRPELVIGVMGCMAQNHKERIFERAPHVDLVCGTSRFEDVVDLLEEVRHGERVLAVDRRELKFDRDISVRPRRFQAFITAMRGCNKYCTFCIVPYTQGRERSRPVSELLDEARRLVDDGVVEITLLGQRIDTYGQDQRDGTNLALLLHRIHEEVPGLLRINFITSHPNFMTDELAATIADHDRISRYLHLPVQSGSERTLKAMNRGYSVDEYRAAVARMRARVPDLAIATDWIVGFPGETEDDFAASVALQRELGFHGSFVFKYSPRAGTRAAELEDDVPRATKEARNQVLLAEQSAMSLAQHTARIGLDLEVLVEGPSKRNAERSMGRTRWNEIVCFPAREEAVGRMLRIRIERTTALTLHGQPI
ncbi:MAG: tRNA (N6-isopentenyl adenosine(37)-C2)-methylthiotransferase MiaB [Planctomycetes bacterium]|nr:tRNA (N6-isopentenyl adenosine(37)-C2)-methylthiotransferase MiaB [Planctomycetota bacterium]